MSNFFERLNDWWANDKTNAWLGAIFFLILIVSGIHFRAENERSYAIKECWKDTKETAVLLQGAGSRTDYEILKDGNFKDCVRFRGFEI